MEGGDSFSWRGVKDALGRDVLLPVVNQLGDVCWAHVAKEAISTQYKIQHMEEEHLKLSLQEALNCVRPWSGEEIATVEQKHGAFYTWTVFQYAAERGLTFDRDYQYVVGRTRCSPPPHATRLFVTGGYTCIKPEEEEKIMSAIRKFPVVGVVNFYTSFADYTKEIGVYRGPEQGEISHGVHAVLLIGFGQDEEDGERYYEIKNSAGPSWGIDGTGKIKRSLLRQIHYPNGVKKVEKIDKDGIKHTYIVIKPTMQRPIQLHVAESGQERSHVVLFCHGFPEIWYSWRNQILAVSQAGLRGIALDYRGFGLSESPRIKEDASFHHLAHDISALLEAMSISEKITLVAKDFGVQVAILFTMLYPTMVYKIITIGGPYLPSISSLHRGLSTGCYLSRWKIPGKAEAEFKQFDVKKIVQKIYMLFSRAEVPEAPNDKGILDLVDDTYDLPNWFSENDLNMYRDLYEKSGFSSALNILYGSSADEDFDMIAEQIEVPVLLVIGDIDYALKIPAISKYIRGGDIKNFVPKLKIKYLVGGTHFAQEQLPSEVNQLILSFILGSRSVVPETLDKLQRLLI